MKKRGGGEEREGRGELEEGGTMNFFDLLASVMKSKHTRESREGARARERESERLSERAREREGERARERESERECVRAEVSWRVCIECVCMYICMMM